MNALASGAPAWAVWVALGLWGVAFFIFGFAFVAARRLWRTKLRAQVEPYLLMFAQPKTKTPDALDVQRPPHKQ